VRRPAFPSLLLDGAMQVRCCFGGGGGDLCWVVPAQVCTCGVVVAFQDVPSHLSGRGVAEAAGS
jgi:hypothetical protein